MAAGSEQGDRTSNALRRRMSSTSPTSAGDPLPANVNSSKSTLPSSSSYSTPSILHGSANETSIQTPRNSSPIGRKRLHRRRPSGLLSTWTGLPDCRTSLHPRGHRSERPLLAPSDKRRDHRRVRPMITSRFDTIRLVAEIAAARNTQQNRRSGQRAMWARTCQTDHFVR
jgi:hypothetical protein